MRGRWWPIGRLGPSGAECELLRAATGDGPDAVSAWRRWRAGSSPAEAPVAQQLLLPAVLAALPDDEPNADDRAFMADLLRRAWAESEALWSNFERFLDLVGPLDCTPIVVKGASPTLRLARGPGARSISDVDVVVPPERFQEVIDVVVQNGWRVGSHLDPWSHAVTVAAPDGRLIDLHRWVVFPRYSEIPELNWFERATTVTERGRTIGCLDRADEMVLAIVHGLSSRGVPAARWPLDVDAILRSVEPDDEEAFWESVIASAVDLGLSLLMGCGLDVCRTTLAMGVPDEVVDRLYRAVSLGQRSRTVTHRVRNNPPGLWTRYRRVERSFGRRPRVTEFVGARRERLRSVGLGRSFGDGLVRSATRFSAGQRRRRR